MSSKKLLKSLGIEIKNMLFTLPEPTAEVTQIRGQPKGVRRRHNQQSVRPQNARDTIEHKSGVGQVLDDVAGYHDIVAARTLELFGITEPDIPENPGMAKLAYTIRIVVQTGAIRNLTEFGMKTFFRQSDFLPGRQIRPADATQMQDVFAAA